LNEHCHAHTQHEEGEKEGCRPWHTLGRHTVPTLLEVFESIAAP